MFLDELNATEQRIFARAKIKKYPFSDSDSPMRGSKRRVTYNPKTQQSYATSALPEDSADLGDIGDE